MVSVIIPVFNAVKYLDDCICSIVRQEHKDWEIILIDDGSTDGSSELCDSWSHKDSRIKVIHQQNSGVSVARNIGIDQAIGDYVYFLDSDDWCFEGIFNEIDGSDIILGEFEGHPHKLKQTDNPALSFLRSDIAMCVGSFILKRTLLTENNIRFKNGCKYGEDLAFFVRCLMHAKSSKICTSPFMFYRQIETSAVHQFTLRRFDVFDAWIDVMHDAIKIGREDIYSYLKNISLPETLTVVSRELFRTGLAVADVKTYIKKNPNMWESLKNSSRNPETPILYRVPSWGLLHVPYLYALSVRLEYSYYDIRAFLGTFKQKLLSK